jgi:hypothetical protein
VVINGVAISDPAAIADGSAVNFLPIETPSGQEHINCLETASCALQQGDSARPAPPASDWGFETAIHTLNSKSAPGKDGVSADLLLFSAPLIKAHLFALLNDCILLCFFPNCWKLAKVVIIGKPNKSDYSSLNSLKPISLVSKLAKLLEKIVLVALFGTEGLSTSYLTPNMVSEKVDPRSQLLTLSCLLWSRLLKKKRSVPLPSPSVSVEPTSRRLTQALFQLPSQVYRIR